ncbi:MAG: hypothetical protein E5Y06_25385 [Mesorhizobium sp.]|nr:MAG: hypothetical protein E5Y06_25385 [Mesorhizobium sp.]TJV00948.1 MAG: hypothetical protein E5Y08_00005 [Mesorhizobium sp.]
MQELLRKRRLRFRQNVKRSSGEIVGRCRPVDQTVTGSLPTGYTTVVVTRGIGSSAVSTSYIVQHHE